MRLVLYNIRYATGAGPLHHMPVPFAGSRVRAGVTSMPSPEAVSVQTPDLQRKVGELALVDIEYNKLGMVITEKPNRFVTLISCHDLMPVTFEVKLHEINGFRVIIDDQDCFVHFSNSSLNIY